jgi:hypothetical protein
VQVGPELLQQIHRYYREDQLSWGHVFHLLQLQQLITEGREVEKH